SQIFASETELARGDQPAPSTSAVTTRLDRYRTARLEKAVDAVDGALRARPDWSEGYLRRGMLYLSLFRRDTPAEPAAETGDEENAEVQARPIWLHRGIHLLERSAPINVPDLLKTPQVSKYLVPAARSFLEARRRCPSVALAHAELASLDYLLSGSE